jgi:L-alanine-DL-glutamate epimerase-like enolase superfamily enzyme
MKIARIRTEVISRRSERPQRNPRMAWTQKNVLLVIVECDDGTAGIGEAWCDGGAPSVTEQFIAADLAPLLLGQDPRRHGAIWQRVVDATTYSIRDGLAYAALSGVDIAIWDWLGKHYGVPVATLLGGRRERVFAYASGGLYAEGKSAADVGQEMQGYVQRGFRGVKLKVGGARHRDDVARVAAAREAIGPDIRLMVDAVYALDVPAAIRMAKALERYDVHFFEAPVHPTDVSGMARVARRSPIPLAGNEFAYGQAQFRRLFDAEAVEYAHMDAIVCGGISEAIRISALAAAHGIACSYHAASSAVCFAANLHVAAAVSNCDSIEVHMIHDLLWDRLPEGSFALDAAGFIAVPATSGLGLGEQLVSAQRTA